MGVNARVSWSEIMTSLRKFFPSNIDVILHNSLSHSAPSCNWQKFTNVPHALPQTLRIEKSQENITKSTLLQNKHLRRYTHTSHNCTWVPKRSSTVQDCEWKDVDYFSMSKKVFWFVGPSFQTLLRHLPPICSIPELPLLIRLWTALECRLLHNIEVGAVRLQFVQGR